MAKLTKNEEYIVDMYVRYFGKAPSKAEIAKYNDFKTPKLILTEIRGDADDTKPLNTKEFVNNAFQNLFGRDATTKEMNKYSKVVDAGKDLPINAIVKSAKKSDKGVYEAKKAIAIMLAEQKHADNYNLDKITKDTYAEVYDLKAKKLLVDSVADLKTEIDAMKDNVTGQTFNLTASINTLPGTEKGDVFNGIVDSAATTNSTLTALDSIDGGAGTDTLNILATVALTLPAGLTVKNVEVVNVKSATTSGIAGVNDIVNDANDNNNNATVSSTLDFSEFAGLTELNINQATQTSVKAATTTDVNVSGVTGAIEVVAAKNVVVTDSKADTNITVGSYVAAAADNTNTAGEVVGTITVTDSNQGTGVILVDGGTDVTVTASSTKTAGDIVIGSVKEATGDVKVTANTTSDASAAINESADITVKGGKTITVENNITNTASKGKGNDVLSGDITIDGGDTTTTVTVKQTVTNTNYKAVTTGDSTETAVLTFGSLKAGEKVAVSESTLTAFGTDLTFTAAKDLTAEEVAAAFANLTAADLQTSGGKVANGIFTGTLDAGWTSTAVSSSSVTFTSTAKTDKTDLVVTAKKADGTIDVENKASFTVATTNGSTGTTTTAQTLVADYGAVVINDNATKSIKTITVDGYGTSSTIGATTNVDALTDLTLKNSDGTMGVTSNVITTLNLNVDNVNDAVTLNATKLTTLNLTASGKDSSFDLTADAVKTLNITANADLDISTSPSTALETATVTGAGNVDLGDLSALTGFTTLTASAATGNITATVAGTDTVTTGSGDDEITVDNTETAISKAIDLGAGNDTLVLDVTTPASQTTAVPTATVKGGEGTDTVSMSVESAAALDGAELFKNSISGFERLEINNTVTSAQTIDLANLGFTSYVTTNGTTVGDATYTGAVTAGGVGETFTFTYNGVEYTATLTTAALIANFDAAVNAAVDAAGNVLGDGKITATDSLGDLVLTADAAGNVVLAGSYDDASTPASIVGTNASATKLKLNKLAANATVVLSAAGSVEAVLATATGTADVINVIIDANDTTINAGKFTVNDVENVNITAQGKFTDDGSFGSTKDDGKDDAEDIASLTLSADKVKTVTVDGYADLTLDTVSTTITKVDASAMTGDLVYTADGATAGTEVIGGAGNDTLRASGENDVLKGGAGNDTFYATDLTTVHGGAGADKFYFATPTQLSKVSTIADLGSGDTIYLIDNKGTGNATDDIVNTFYSAGAQYNANTTTTFEAKVNASLAQTGAGEATWFQHTGNTYIVIDNKAGGDVAAGAVDTYTAGGDVVIEITGLVDLSKASFNATTGSLEIA